MNDSVESAAPGENVTIEADGLIVMDGVTTNFVIVEENGRYALDDGITTVALDVRVAYRVDDQLASLELRAEVGRMIREWVSELEEAFASPELWHRQSRRTAVLCAICYHDPARGLALFLDYPAEERPGIADSMLEVEHPNYFMPLAALVPITREAAFGSALRDLIGKAIGERVDVALMEAVIKSERKDIFEALMSRSHEVSAHAYPHALALLSCELEGQDIRRAISWRPGLIEDVVHGLASPRCDALHCRESVESLLKHLTSTEQDRLANSIEGLDPKGLPESLGWLSDLGRDLRLRRRLLQVPPVPQWSAP